MAWIESHQSLLDHPKTKRAARLLDIPRVHLVGHLHALWWWALDYAPDGDLSRWDAVDIADAAHWEGDPDAFVEALANCGPGGGHGFITPNLHIHDWADYTGKLMAQRAANRERQRRYRERQKGQDEEVDEDDTPAEATSPLANAHVTVTTPSPNGATNQQYQPDQPNRTKRSEPRGPREHLPDSVLRTGGVPPHVGDERPGRNGREDHPDVLRRQAIRQTLIELRGQPQTELGRARLEETVGEWIARGATSEDVFAAYARHVEENEDGD